MAFGDCDIVNHSFYAGAVVARDEVVVVDANVLGHQHAHILPQNLVNIVLPQLLGGDAELHNHALRIGDDNGDWADV